MKKNRDAAQLRKPGKSAEPHVISEDDADDEPRFNSKKRKQVQALLPNLMQVGLLNNAQALLARFFYGEGVALCKTDSPLLEEALQAFIRLGQSGVLAGSVRATPSRYKACFE